MENAIKIVAAQAGLAVAGGADYFATRGSSSKEPSSTSQPVTVDNVLHAANGIIKASRSYGFVCTTPSAHAAPDCRVMDLHKLTDKSLEFGLVSRSFTRKAATLKERSACTIAFHDPRASSEAGYLALSGNARELRTLEERNARWKPSWSFFHPGPHDKGVVQWVFEPHRLELVSNLTGLTDEWAPITALREGETWRGLPRRAERT